MKTIKQKKKIITIGIIIVLLLYAVYCSENRINMLAGTSTYYLKDYREFYFYSKQVNSQGIWGAVSRKIVYLKPGQRKKMTLQIKEDIINSLETLITEHNDIFYKYDINDSFDEIFLYETPGGIGEYGFRDLQPDTITRIKALFWLYHDIEKGRTTSQPTDFTFEIIAPDNLSS